MFNVLFEINYRRIAIGIPVPIVAISTGVAHDQYGHDDLWVIILFSCIIIPPLYKAVG